MHQRKLFEVAGFPLLVFSLATLFALLVLILEAYRSVGKYEVQSGNKVSVDAKTPDQGAPLKKST